MCPVLCFFFWFGLSLFAGALEIASYFRRVLAVLHFVALLLWSELRTTNGFVAGIPNKKLAQSLICRKAGCFFTVLVAIVVVDPESGRRGALKLADWVRAYPRWSSPSYGAGACNRGRRPAMADMPPYFLAEGRLSLFLLAMAPLGRQFNCRSKAMAASSPQVAKSPATPRWCSTGG